MPLYMDLHKLDGATAEDVAKAHVQDEEIQGKYGVKYLTYWFNEAVGKIFCLVDAPSVNAAVRVHREAHGLVADEIIEVDQRTVEGFLGKVQEAPAKIEPSGSGGEPAVDTAFRAILFTDMEGSTALTQRLGDAGAMALLRVHNTLIRDALHAHNGSEVKHTGDGIMASFVAVSGAVACAIRIQTAFASHNEGGPETPIRVRIGLTAGEPVMENGDLFGAAVQLASRICDCAEPDGILVANVIRELCMGKGFSFADSGERTLRGFEDPVRLYEVRWRE